MAYNKRVKSYSYALSKKVWLNSKYVKTKYYQKLDNKFFSLFYIIYIIKKQVYKQKLFTK